MNEQENKPKTLREWERLYPVRGAISSHDAQEIAKRSRLAWNAATEVTRAEYDEKIKAMQAEIDDLKMRLDTCKNDYWFMTNLLERYSSADLQSGVNDCIERMKFRKGLFKNLNQRGEDE